MAGEFGEGTSSDGSKTVLKEGEQGLYQPETLQNGGGQSTDPDQPDIAAIVRESTDGSEDLQRFRPIADKIAREVAESGGAPLSGNALKPLLRGLREAYLMGQSEASEEGPDVTDEYSLAELDEGAGAERD